MTALPKLITRDVLRVAVEADVDERTVRNRLDGATMKPRTKVRVDAALRALGLGAYVPAEPAAKTEGGGK